MKQKYPISPQGFTEYSQFINERKEKNKFIIIT